MEHKMIIEGNKLIAPFDGYEIKSHKGIDYYSKNGIGITIEEYRPDLNWNLMMTAVDSIELIEDDRYGRFSVHIYSNACSIESTKTDPCHKLPLYMSDPNAILNTKLESTWYNVVSFIKWYSQHKQTTPLNDK